MNLYIDELLAGMTETLALYKSGSNIFEMKGGSLFPNIGKQQMWQFSKGDKHLNFTDGNNTYSFQGNLAEEDTDLEKLPDVPLGDMYMHANTRGKAQVHRADPGSIYFTLQEGTRNPTYTLRHIGDSKWRAIPKKKKVKEQMAAPAFIENVNVDKVKEGMFKELEKLSEGSGGLLSFFNHAAGQGVTGAVEGTKALAMAPGAIGGDSSSNPWADAGKAALVGGGLGLGYHALKRHFINTPEQNETEGKGELLKRMLIPATGMAGMNLVERDVFPNYYNLMAQGKTPQLTS